MFILGTKIAISEILLGKKGSFSYNLASSRYDVLSDML
jgi:hypothetical protein